MFNSFTAAREHLTIVVARSTFGFGGVYYVNYRRFDIKRIAKFPS
jgi:hypothetical protein